MAMNETSSPVRNSSTRIRSAALPNFFSPKTVCRNSSASSAFFTMTTPLPAAGPLALQPRGKAHLLERGGGLVGGAARDGLGGRNRVLPHELFREDLGAFELRGQAGGAEDREAALLELV